MQFAKKKRTKNVIKNKCAFYSLPFLMTKCLMLQTGTTFIPETMIKLIETLTPILANLC